jgi:hypothetical protein
MLSKHIDAYLKDHETAWAPTTMQSEAPRLRARSSELKHGPAHLYEVLQSEGMKPYAIKTLFVRVCKLEAWVNKGSEFREWMKKHNNRFKHAYVKEDIGITFEQAVERINTLDEPYKTLALEMLQTGLRTCELDQIENGMVIGKGAKRRPVFGTISLTVPRHVLRAKLKAVGLKPHTLRKLCATRLAERGASPQDLCKVFGWSSITTAYQYLQSKDNDRLRELVEKSTKGP